MKFRIIATVVMLVVLFLLYAVFSGGDTSVAPTETPVSLDGF